MPELPEVERAARQIKRLGQGKVIERIQATEDSLVFSETTHTEFADELTGRRITDVKRYGKIFYIELDGKGKLPVLHFGMTGMLQVRGEIATYYKETPKSANADWPPRFMKFILHLKDESTNDVTEIAFLDARRLGRIRLRESPSTEPPISQLGFDPVLCMPCLDDFSKLALKRNCPIKALLLDQSFSAGVGNWVADEILYHSRVHPEQRCTTLTSQQLKDLHRNMQKICKTAISVDADDTKFPEDWLFKHRWGKGKKAKSDSFKLPSGEPATIDFITVGGRTSAYVVELQHLVGEKPTPKPKRQRTSKRSAEDTADEAEGSLSESAETMQSPAKKRKSPQKSTRTSSRSKDQQASK